MFLKNTSLYFTGEMVNRVGKLGALYLLAAVLSKSAFGHYAYLTSLCLIVLSFLDFGMNSLVMLRTSWKRFEHLLPFFFAGKLIIVPVVCSILAIYDLTRGFIGVPGALTPFLLLCIGWDASAFLGNALRARLDFMGEFWIKIIANVGFLLLLAAALLLSIKLTIVAALWLQALAFLPACLLGIVRVRPGIANNIPPARHAKRGLLAIGKIGAPMSMAASVGVVQPSIDSIVLGAGNHMEVNASFSLVNRLGQLVQMPVNVVMFSALPYLIQKLREGFKLNPDTLPALVLILALSGTAVAQLFALAVEWIIPLALGPAYLDARFFGGVLALYIVPYYIFPIYSNLLAARRYVVTNNVILAVCTIAGALTDVVAIQHYGPASVAFVNVFFNWVLFTVFGAYYRYAIGTAPIDAKGLAAVCVGSLTVAAPLLLVAASKTESALRLGLAAGAAALAMHCFLRSRKALAEFVRP